MTKKGDFMNNTKKILIGGVLASVLSATSIAQAEGFFSKLFGGSSDAAGFKSMLLHVPADTSYMFANKNPIPEDVMDFHMKRSQEAFKMISKFSNCFDLFAYNLLNILNNIISKIIVVRKDDFIQVRTMQYKMMKM